jgi:hypothetical protein
VPAPENPLTGLQSSRRNLIRISAIVASAIIAKITPAAGTTLGIKIGIGIGREIETEIEIETGMIPIVF